MNAPSANDLFHACQDLARSGQPVFPCLSKGKDAKKPLTKWRDNATLDINQIKQWWRSHRTAAIGIPTGIKWDVLDVDIKNGKDGRLWLPYLNRVGLLDGCKRVVKTPSGGWHLYFRASPLTNKAKADLGLDLRAKGGYVLAAPSHLTDAVSSDGTVYSGPYKDAGSPLDATDDPLRWDLIMSAIAPIDTDTNKPVELLGYERQSSIAALRGWLSERRAGERNNSLHWAVCRCIDNGIDPNELMEVALHIGLSEDEAGKTINSALRRAGLAADDLDTEAEAMFGKD